MRGKRAVKKIVQPDPLYGSKLVSRLINKVMVDGKKAVARSLVYKALDTIEIQTKKNPVQVFESAVANLSPKMEVRPRRVGGASYQVPVEVRGDRREALSLRWLIDAARNKSNKEFHSFSEKLATEILDASDNKGSAMKKKEDMHKSAEANKAFAHFRW